MDFAKFLLGALLGYSLAVPPGPMNALIAAWSLKSFRHGFAVGAGAMSADFLLMLLTLALSTALKSLGEIYYTPFYAAGGAFFLYLAYKIAASKPPKEGGAEEDAPRGATSSASVSVLLIRTKCQQERWESGRREPLEPLAISPTDFA